MNYISLLSPWSVQLRQCSAAARRREEVQCGPGCVDVQSGHRKNFIRRCWAFKFLGVDF